MDSIQQQLLLFAIEHELTVVNDKGQEGCPIQLSFNRSFGGEVLPSVTVRMNEMSTFSTHPSNLSIKL